LRVLVWAVNLNPANTGSAGLVLTVPQKHTLRSDGAVIGSLKHLRPTFTLPCHTTGMGAIKAYLGAGVRYTRFTSVAFTPAVVAALGPRPGGDSYGFALQAGVDIATAKNMHIAFGVKKVQIKAHVNTFGAKVGSLRVDPRPVGVGLGWCF